MSGQTLKDKLAKGLFWTGFSNVLQQLLNLIFGIFLARILSRADYGLVGMLSIFSLIAGTFKSISGKTGCFSEYVRLQPYFFHFTIKKRNLKCFVRKVK